MALFNRLKTPFAEASPGAPAAAVSGPRLAGEALRQRREQLGLDLADCAAGLKIKPAYLAALEEGRPDELPGPAYAIGFLRAYSEHLDLDSGEVLRRFRQGSTAASARPDLSFPMPLVERSMPGSGMLLVAVILAICGYGTWYYLSTGEHSQLERVAEVPPELLQPQPPRGRTTELRAEEVLAASPTARPTVDGLSEAANSGFDPAGRPLTLPPVPAPPPSSAALPAQTGGIAPGSALEGASNSADAAAQIVIHATADSWVEIRDATRSVLLRRVLKSGESYRVPEQPGLSMRTGNAGGLEITVGDKPAPPLGRMGAVRRNIALNPETLLAGTAAHE